MSLFLFDYYSISLFLGGLAAAVSTLLVVFGGQSTSARSAWMFFNITALVWSFAYLFMINTTNSEIAWWANNILHNGAIMVPIGYLLSILFLTNTYKRHFNFLVVSLSFSVLFLLANQTTLFVSSVVPKYTFNYVPNAGPLYIYFTIYFFVIAFYGLWILIQTATDLSQSKKDRMRVWYVFIASIFGFIGGGSVFFLTFNVQIPPYPIVLFAFYPITITYAAIRHQLFNAKVIVTELFTFGLILLVLFRTLLSDTAQDQLINAGMLVLVVTISIFLIVSVRREVETREKIEKLATQLKDSNERLRQLDQLKTEFLSIATHQLRTPLTAIKGYISLVLEGAYGKVPEKMQKVLGNVFQSSSLMAETITDFMNVSRIELGHIEYNKADFNCLQLIKEVVEELKPRAKEAGLELKFENLYAENKSPIISGDYGKVKYIFSNLIENAIKYTPKGSIVVSGEVDQKKHTTRIIIADTGIGINKDELDDLFLKFKRARNAHNINIQGTGLGLYVAREMVKAHDGSIWVESDGEGKGSTFIVELPLVRVEKKENT